MVNCAGGDDLQQGQSRRDPNTDAPYRRSRGTWSQVAHHGPVRFGRRRMKTAGKVGRFFVYVVLLGVVPLLGATALETLVWAAVLLVVAIVRWWNGRKPQYT